MTDRGNDMNRSGRSHVKFANSGPLKGFINMSREPMDLRVYGGLETQGRVPTEEAADAVRVLHLETTKGNSF